MIVVADSSPLHYLVLLEVDQLLEQPYGRVIVPTVVMSELSHAAAPAAVREWVSRPPSWIQVCMANPEFISISRIWPACYDGAMRDLAVLFLHLLTTVARLTGPGGARALVAESVLVKHQLLILNRSRKHAPNLRLADRLVAGVCTLFIRPTRLVRSAIVLQPSMLLRFHRALIRRKYRRLFSSTVPKKPGPKGPSREVVAAVVEMKQRNPTWVCPRIAQ